MPNTEHVVFSYQQVIWTARSLEERGVSTIGARQLLNGQLMTNGADRERVAGIMIQLLNPDASGGSYMPQTKEHILLAR